MDDYVTLMTASGYSRRQAREVVRAGLMGYETKKERTRGEGKPLHCHKSVTQKGRSVRK